MPRAKNPEYRRAVGWTTRGARTASQARLDRATFAPSTHRRLLAQYQREELDRRGKYGRKRSGIWSELARISGLGKDRIHDLRRDARYSPTRTERIALALATGLLPIERWFVPDPKPPRDKLHGE